MCEQKDKKKASTATPLTAHLSSELFFTPGWAVSESTKARFELEQLTSTGLSVSWGKN